MFGEKKREMAAATLNHASSVLLVSRVAQGMLQVSVVKVVAEHC